MKLVAKVKLQPSPEQARALKETLKVANAACNYISNLAWQTKTFGQYKLHKLVYYDIRERFGLTAQMAVHCIAKVVDAYKLRKGGKRAFKPYSAIPYDSRILRWYPDASEVSIWTTHGRQRIAFVCGDRQRRLLQAQQGESDLVYYRGEFYLFATCEAEEPEPVDFQDVLGVDFGIKNIAVDSDGTVYSASHLLNVRHRYRRLRARLQRKGTKSAKRRLKALSGREARFRNDANHVIAKRIVERAQGTCRAIAIEELRYIRDRVTVRRSQRATLRSWPFADLRRKIEYKARLAGVPVIVVDPRDTSRTCPRCGCIDKRNRPNQATFSCVRCGFAGHADHIAAENIRRAAVNQPNVSDATPVAAPGTSSPVLTGSR